MYSSIFPALGWIFILATLGLAWWRGGSPERYGALAIFVTALEVWAIEHFAPRSSETILLLISDFLLAVAFLILAVRYASLWLGLAMLLQAGQFGLHFVYEINEMAHDRRYAVVNNVVTTLILVVIFCGLAASWRRRLMRPTDEYATTPPSGAAT